MGRDTGQSSYYSEPYERLANAIIIQAARDYRAALRKLSRNKDNKDAHGEIAEIERFFHSGLYGALTGVDPDMLIRKLKEEMQ